MPHSKFNFQILRHSLCIIVILVLTAHPYLYIHVADLTLTQKVCATAGQGGVNSTSTCLNNLREEFRNTTFTTVSPSLKLSTVSVEFF